MLQERARQMVAGAVAISIDQAGPKSRIQSPQEQCLGLDGLLAIPNWEFPPNPWRNQVYRFDAELAIFHPSSAFGPGEALN
jgi:hypothetical protein